MFELSIIRKYLIPWNKPLSVTLIALMSIGVIALVVWLIVLFLSVTEGIERNWLKKLTALHAPIRISPTSKYYGSYSYLIDTISHASKYLPRSFQEKISEARTDLYDPTIDETIPLYWPQPEKNLDGSIRDPVKALYAVLSDIQKRHTDFVFETFELSGAMLRLQLVRPSPSGNGIMRSFLTQATYLSSFSDPNLYTRDLIMKPSSNDLNHLFFMAFTPLQEPLSERVFQTSEWNKHLNSLLAECQIKTVRISQHPWAIPIALLPENHPIPVTPAMKYDRVSHFIFNPSVRKSSLRRKGENLLWQQQQYNSDTPLIVNREIVFEAELISDSLPRATQLSDLRLKVEGELEGISLGGEIPWNGIEILEGTWSMPKLFQGAHGILLPKGFVDNGVKIGDRGWLVYPSTTPGALQEQRLAVFVSGFYDPGIIAVGNKCVLASHELVHMLNMTSRIEHFDKTTGSGFSVWFSDLKRSEEICNTIRKALIEAKIDPYWKVSTYREYDFAKDLLGQFQSDRYLFTLIGVMILFVACSNIVSLLVILVNDKKKEIGILRALGASRFSITLIFGGTGAILGVVGSLIGVLAAFITLQNLDSVVHFLGFFQGQEVFSPVFFGSELPHYMSSSTLFFVLIVAPIFSLFAGIIPAYRACHLTPSQILRSE